MPDSCHLHIDILGIDTKNGNRRAGIIRTPSFTGQEV